MSTLPAKVVKEFEVEAAQLSARVTQIEAMPLSQMSAALAKELVDEVKAKLDARHRILDPFVESAFRAHKENVAERAKYINPLESAWTKLRARIGAWERERQRRIEEERRRKEEEQRKAQEAERAAEVKRLEEEAAARAAEAKALEERGMADAAAARAEEARSLVERSLDTIAAPLAPIHVHVDEDKGKIAGASASVIFEPEVHDMAKFLHYIADNPALWRLRGAGEPPCPPGELKRFVNQNKGLEVPGVKLSDGMSVRTRSA